MNFGKIGKFSDDFLGFFGRRSKKSEKSKKKKRKRERDRETAMRRALVCSLVRNMAYSQLT